MNTAERDEARAEVARLKEQYGPWTDPEDGQQWFGLSAQSHRNIQRNLARLKGELEDANAALDTAKHHVAVAEWNEKAAHEAVNASDAAVEWATLTRVLMIIDRAIADCDHESKLFASDVLASVRKKIEVLGAPPVPDPRDAEIAKLREALRDLSALRPACGLLQFADTVNEIARAALGDGSSVQPGEISDFT